MARELMEAVWVAARASRDRLPTSASAMVLALPTGRSSQIGSGAGTIKTEHPMA